MEICSLEYKCGNFNCPLRLPHEPMPLCKDTAIRIKGCVFYDSQRPVCRPYVSEEEKVKGFEVVSISDNLIGYEYNGEHGVALIIKKGTLDEMIKYLNLWK